MRYEIYKIQNKINKKVYVGITNQGYKRRCKHHFSAARNGSTFILHQAMMKYGTENFDCTLLEECSTIEELKEREIFWISSLKCCNREFGYNMTEGGDGTFGRLHSEETKGLISESKQINVSIKNLDTLEVNFYNSLTEASLALGYKDSYLSLRKRRFNSDTFIINNYEIIIKKNLYIPKWTKNKNQDIPAHMEMMREKSNASRALNREGFIKNSKEAKLSKTKIVQQLTLEGELIAEYNGAREAAKELGRSRSPIQHCLQKRTNTAYGCKWQFKN